MERTSNKYGAKVQKKNDIYNICLLFLVFIGAFFCVFLSFFACYIKNSTLSSAVFCHFFTVYVV